jgi:polysaccharide export outer membrane protein
VHAADLTVLQLEDRLKALLKTYLKEPQVTVTLTESRSQPVTFVGAVVSPGTYQLRGRTSLLEMLTGAAGGLKPDAGSTARIMRRLSEGRIPVPGATDDPSGQFSVAEVNLKDVLASQSAVDIALRPYDVITIGQAPLVYVIGEVTRQGSIPASGRLTVLQALALSGGWTHTAAPRKAKILRSNGGPTRTEMAVNLNDVLAGKSIDLPMMPDDILLVPDSAGKKITARTVEGMISAGTAILTYGIVR